MAKEIGISPSEYSKLENGFKKNWEKYWDNIAAVLQITPFKVVFEDCTALNQNNKPNLESEQEKLNQSINDKVVKALKEKDVLKDELLLAYKLNAEYWKGKYERAKIRLEKAEGRIIELINKPFQISESITFENSLSLANVGGGTSLE